MLILPLEEDRQTHRKANIHGKADIHRWDDSPGLRISAAAVGARKRSVECWLSCLVGPT